MLANLTIVGYLFVIAPLAAYKMYAFLTNHMVDEDADFYGAFADEDDTDLEKEKWDDYNNDIASGLSFNQ